LLNENFAELATNLDGNDYLLVLDNGNNQRITLCGRAVEIVRSPANLGVPKSWNYFLRRAFVDGRFDALMILGDDVRIDSSQVRRAKQLLAENPDVDLLLSFSIFDVQVHRRNNVQTIGYFDERYSPAWCEDDDYALTMIKRGRIYERFHDLDPLPGSIVSGTEKSVSWHESRQKFAAKWPDDLYFGINALGLPHFITNRLGPKPAHTPVPHPAAHSCRFRKPLRDSRIER
jgi:hypothetical protein